MRTAASTPAARPAEAEPAEAARAAAPAGWAYVLVGILFGLALVKSQSISWFKLQEMFRFQSFHLYGVFMGAVGTAAPLVRLLKRSGARTRTGEPVAVPPKRLGRGHRYWIGGSIFGVGLALTGACPGPLVALIGSGVTVMSVVFVSALAGAWAYGWLRPRLPH